MECRAVTLDHSGECVTHVASPPSREDLENALTEAKRVDPDLRRIIDTIPVLAWCNLPDGSVEFANQRWHDYTGLSPEGTRGWGWTVAIHADDLETMTGKWQALLASGQTGEIEARLRRYDGEYRWFLFRAEPVRDNHGNIFKWYGANTDIDDRKCAEALLAAETRTLEMIANGARLADILERLCATIDAQARNTTSAVMLMDADRMRLWPVARPRLPKGWIEAITDRKSTRLNSSHLVISYAVFCLKKKKTTLRRSPDASVASVLRRDGRSRPSRKHFRTTRVPPKGTPIPAPGSGRRRRWHVPCDEL